MGQQVLILYKEGPVSIKVVHFGIVLALDDVGRRLEINGLLL